MKIIIIKLNWIYNRKFNCFYKKMSLFYSLNLIDYNWINKKILLKKLIKKNY